MIEFPSTWETRPLGDIVDILDSKRVPLNAAQRAARPGDVPYYGAAGQVGWIDEPIFDEPLVLLGEDGVQFFDAAKQKAYLISGPSWVNNHAHVLRAREVVDRRFLNYWLNVTDYRGLANGTTRLKLTQAAMKRIPVPLPSLDEQQRVVDVLEDHLSRLDAAVELVRASIRREKALRDSALWSWVDQAHDSADVELVTLGAMAKVTSGLTPLKANKAFYEGGTIPWITSGDLHQGLITQATNFVTERALEETTLKMVPEGALLVAMYGEGKTRGTAAELGIDATTNQACAAVVLHDPALRPWVRLVLDANYTRLRRLAAGGVQPNLNLSIVKAIKVPLPNRALRAELLAQRSELDDKATRLRDELEAAQRRGANLRRSLLAAAFSGRLTKDLSAAEVARAV